MPTPKDVHVLIPRTCDPVTSGVITVRTLRWGVFLDYWMDLI